MSELFMGKNSVEVYFDLKEKRIDLKDEIIRLKKNNAKLQKELFELKSLEPDEQIKEDFKNIKNEEDK
jgi:predicted nuclease with TOPRIM domain